MTQQERAETFFRRHRGLFFCAACLARELAISAFEGRNVLWKLQGLPGYEMRGARCAGCLRGKRVVRHLGGVSIAGARGDVVAFLLSNAGIALCEACLAFATERSLMEVHEVIETLQPFREFRRQEGICTVCSRTRPLTCAVFEQSASGELEALATGTEIYRGWRLDLLSYRIRDGWRPLVLIKGASASRSPDAPSLLWETLPTRIAADQQALKAAKSWIDKVATE